MRIAPLVLLLAVGTASADSNYHSYQHRIDPRISLWQAGLYQQQPLSAPRKLAPVLIRFSRIPSSLQLQLLEAHGVHFSRVSSASTSGGEGARLHLGPFYPAEVDAGGQSQPHRLLAGQEPRARGPLLDRPRPDLDGDFRLVRTVP